MDGGMMLRPSRAAARSSSRAAWTAVSSRWARHASSRAIWSASAAGSTISTPSSPVASGDGSVSVKALTPTTVWSPASIASSRVVLDSTSWRFM